jgi:hypothetical protein
MRNLILIFFSTVILNSALFSQADRWQQRVKYNMDVNLDVSTNILKGKQSIEYWNNSPDTLKVIYYHLYWNAFQPQSMMDVRNRELGRNIRFNRNDWEPKIADKNQKLGPTEMGYQKMINLKMNGRPQKTELHETILKVILDKPILPKTKVLLEADFETQVPVMVRRAGRDNTEGVRFSMSQWYPKLAEYDYEGWHPTPYVGREFYGIWGDFNVNITLDKKYIIGASGYLQNPNEIGYGYEAPGTVVKKPAGNSLTWKFSAPNVHDFAWAADPEYKHISKKIRDGLTIHAFYKIDPEKLKSLFASFSANNKAIYRNSSDLFIRVYQGEWETVLERAAYALPYMEKKYGRYPYKQYSFIQGGDGGMEYAMATILKGAGDGVIYHEWMHSWYQMVLGTNESLNAWMDEGFTQFAEHNILAYIKNDTTGFSQENSYASYFQLVKSGIEEPLTTHADHFESRFGYVTSAYDKGAVFLEQLGYITGEETRDRILLEYFRKWKFRHPGVNDFFRVAEEVSGLQLDWYRLYFVNSTKTIDYGIDSLWQENNKLNIRLKNNGRMPMPLDVLLTFKDGSKEMAYIPQYLMFGIKPSEDSSIKRTVFAPWKWTHPYYSFEINRNLVDLKSVEIDPSKRMADTERKNNRLEISW